MDKTRQDRVHDYRKSYHVRLKPAPALILITSTAVNDRLEISEGFVECGVYRRVSASFIATLTAERDAQRPGTARYIRLDEILQAAIASPGAGDSDLGNLPVPDLSYY